MTEFAKRLEEQGCEVSVAAKASQWHIERERDIVELGKLYGESLSGVSRFQICLKFFKQ